MSTSIADILRRKRRATTPGFAGGTLEEQVLNEGEPEPPQLLTPQNQQAITRPRTITRHSPLGPQPERPANIPPNAHWDATGIGPDGGEWIAPGENDVQRPRAVTFDPQTGRPNEDFYRERGDTSGLVNAYQNWQPHGGKRGFKNSLKAALMMGAEGARANPNDPVTGALAGLAIGAGAGTAVPDFTNRLRRQQKLGQFGGELKSQLDLQKQQAAIDQSQMVEVELDNGQRVMVPAKSAATLQSRQQEIGLRGDTLQARKGRWDKLGEHEAARDAQALYNSGAADDSAELRAEIARRLRLPAGTALPPRGLGNQIKLDESGNYVIISPRSGEVTQTNQKSYEPVREAGRDRRATQAQQAAMSRVQAQQAGANQRAGMRGPAAVKVDPTTKREIAKGYGEYDELHSGLSTLDEQIKQANTLPANWTGSDGKDTKNDLLRRLGRQRTDAVAAIRKRMAELNQLDPENEWGAGEGGYPYRKPREGAQAQSSGKYAGRRISQANVAEYGKRHGMTVEQARDYLSKEGAIIY